MATVEHMDEGVIDPSLKSSAPGALRNGDPYPAAEYDVVILLHLDCKTNV
jgi:hypothetical protein